VSISDDRNPYLRDALEEWRKWRDKSVIKPDVTDKFGRVWTWWKGDLYRHCSMAWTLDMIRAGNFTLPNVKYEGMCAICWPPERDADG
jgi:hypothetical protein